ncbi:TBC1 domain family member 10A isoform X2 [Trichechus manatus latirostris]|uniref:TBC1 domain family member 10A isoform X2 n=1 Tax=Trichechus manatus latirostris TaxID=127582 RepID=A0A2Y9R1L5_TRIMA|nr:TBC1 domain family member 10A isoform X2 [Trichechus manatus latirostris]
MAKSRGENGPRAPAPGGSLSGTRESLAPGPDAAAADELSSLGSDSEANGFAERRIDKFGFIVGSQGAEGALEEVSLEVLRQRESKWLDMLNNWDKWMAKKHKKIRLRCQKGIPPSLRGRAWQYLSGGKVKLQQNPGKFDEAIQLDGEILFSLLQKVSPVAHKHLSRQKIDPLLYMTEWFMCVFARTLPWSSVLRVWDMFFCEGVKIIFRVGLVLLKHALGSPEKLKACQGQYETIERLRSLSPKIMQEAFLVQEVVELPVTERQIEREHLIQLRRWQETRGELQCCSSPRLHGAKAILEAEPGLRLALQTSPSIRLPLDAPVPDSRAKPKLPKQVQKEQKEQRKRAKASGQLDQPPATGQAEVAAAAGDACPSQDMALKDPVPQNSAHHCSQDSLTSQESEDTYL